MRRYFIKAHSKVAKFFDSRKVKLFADTTLMLASSYLILKRTTEFSISDWLLANALQPPFVALYLVVASISLILAIIFKLGMIILDYFPPLNHKFVQPDEISNCLYRMNSEISNHIEKCDNSAPVNVRTLREQHGCKVNLALITESLAEHIRCAVKNIKIKNKDIFISLYAYNDKSGSLEYVLHYDPKRDLVESKTIELRSRKYAEYECVKCLNSTNTTAYVLDKKDYKRGASKRGKTIQHYIGCKLSSENKVFGFLNIEFHNNPIFPDEDSMRNFLEEHIFPFKLLFEYQYLKKEFFNSFHEFDNYWRVA